MKITHFYILFSVIACTNSLHAVLSQTEKDDIKKHLTSHSLANDFAAVIDHNKAVEFRNNLIRQLVDLNRAIDNPAIDSTIRESFKMLKSKLEESIEYSYYLGSGGK